jgi:hypothetical protein
MQDRGVISSADELRFPCPAQEARTRQARSRPDNLMERKKIFKICPFYKRRRYCILSY